MESCTWLVFSIQRKAGLGFGNDVEIAQIYTNFIAETSLTLITPEVIMTLIIIFVDF